MDKLTGLKIWRAKQCHRQLPDRQGVRLLGEAALDAPRQPDWRSGTVTDRQLPQLQDATGRRCSSLQRCYLPQRRPLLRIAGHNGRLK